MSTAPLLTYQPKGDGVRVDLDRLIASRLLIQANSGAGKSRAIRQLLEETHGRVPHLVIDPEGEFSTLRESFDYVLAAKAGGDVEASPKTARILARRLVEIGASAVLDLYELALHDRREFVRLFLIELMGLPRTLWRPLIIVIDEMHVFCPERGSGEASSTESVITLATQGRKRGFCLVGATQRISKLHKDAAAELLNKMIGRTGLDVDVKRAGDELGMGKEERAALKTLAPGEFFAYGPAISNAVQIVRTGAVVTSHPEAGTIGTVAPPAPAKVKALIAASLADLPKEAEAEARSLEDLRKQNADLARKLRQAEKSEKTGSAGPPRIVEKPVVDEAAVQRAVTRALDSQAREISKRHWDAFKQGRGAVQQIERIGTTLTETVVPGLRGMLAALEVPIPIEPQKNGNGDSHRSLSAPTGHQQSRRESPVQPPRVPKTRQPSVAGGEAGRASLGKGERRILTAIAQHDDAGGVTREQLSVLTEYRRSSRDTYLQKLSAAGYIDASGPTIVVTAAGVAALGDDYEPLPTGDALREYWLARLGGGEQKILAAVCEAYPDTVSRDALAESAGYQRSSRDTYLQKLGARKLVTFPARGEVRASDMLFDEALR